MKSQAKRPIKRPNLILHNVHVHVPFGKIREHLALLMEHRLNLEVYFNCDSLDSTDASGAKSLLESLDYGPSFTIHAPFMDLSPGAVDAGVMAVTRRRFSQVFDIAAAIGPKTVVFHSGYEKWKYSHDVDLWLERSLPTWRELIERAAGIGSKIAIENIFEDEPESLRLLMDALSSPHAGICFDTGHFNLFSKRPLSFWLETLGPHIVEFHVHDNDGNRDDHLAVGDGRFDFELLFNAPRFKENPDIVYTIENHTPDGVLRSIEALSGMLKKSKSLRGA